MSEFGRGYAICLLMFTFHEPRLDEMLAHYRTLSKEPSRTGHVVMSEVFDDAHACEIWMNGASDHLYELVRPRKRIPRDQWKRAQVVAAMALDIGHGFRRKSNENECRWLLLEAKELIALASAAVGVPPVNNFKNVTLLDEALGLKPDRGTWGCQEPLRRDQ